MSLRSLSPFLVSFLILSVAVGTAPRALAETSGMLVSFNSPLSAHRSQTVDTVNTEAGNSVAQSHKDSAITDTPAAVVGVPALAPTQGAKAAPGYTLSREQFTESLRDQLLSRFNLEGELQIELSRIWTEPAPSKDPITLVVSECPNQMASQMVVRVKLESNGSTISEPVLVVKAQLWREAWVTTQPMSRDEAFDTSKLDAKRVDVLRERDAIPVTIAAKNYTIARNVMAGKLLTWRDLTRKLLVKKGEMVDVSAVEGALSITMKALAIQNGSEGDTILVRNLDSKKDISAQVIGENRVQVHF